MHSNTKNSKSLEPSQTNRKRSNSQIASKEDLLDAGSLTATHSHPKIVHEDQKHQEEDSKTSGNDTSNESGSEISGITDEKDSHLSHDKAAHESEGHSPRELPQEEDEEVKMFLKNRDKYPFVRPILFKADIDKCERIDYSYIRIPEFYSTGTMNPQYRNDPTKVNQDYMGVPPECSEFYRGERSSFFQNQFDSMLMSMEDQRYELSTSFLIKKDTLNQLETIKATENEEKQVEMLVKMMAKNEYLKDKFVKDPQNEFVERVNNLINNIKLDVSQLRKKQEAFNKKIKKKWAICQQLSLKYEEMFEAHVDRAKISNKAIKQGTREIYSKMQELLLEQDFSLLKSKLVLHYKTIKQDTMDKLFDS